MRRSLAVAAAACVVLAGVAPAATDHGVLQRFSPASASTWWAVVASNLKPEAFVVRTADAGRTWRDVTPPVSLVASSFFLGRNAAWIEAGALVPPLPRSAVYRTLDGGRTWRRLGVVRTECQLDFVDADHGWCVSIGAATGSETVRLYRTSDGGATWRLVTRTGLYGSGSTPGALPFACDKSISFTSRMVGWAATTCGGGTPSLCRSTDGGAHWHALARVPLPKGAPAPPAGEGLSLPAVAGRRLAVAVQIGGDPHGMTAIATSSDGGRSWRTTPVPGAPRSWQVDLVDPRHWRLGDGTLLLATDDAGRSWRRRVSPVPMKDVVGATLGLDFLSPSLGFAVPTANDGPLWWTRDGGATWAPVTIKAGPFTVGLRR